MGATFKNASWAQAAVYFSLKKMFAEESFSCDVNINAEGEYNLHLLFLNEVSPETKDHIKYLAQSFFVPNVTIQENVHPDNIF